MTVTGEQGGVFTVGPAQVRVVTDCPVDMSFIIEAEKRVVRRLVDRGLWPHEMVTVFVLDDLTMLADHLMETHGLVAEDLAQLPQRPMVNLYDPRQSKSCLVFVNRQIMTAEGYWNDGLAAQALLAHEHAHPLSESPVTGAARRLTVEAEGPDTLGPLAAQLGRTLSAGAVTELRANAFCLTSGFAEAMMYLNRLTLRRAMDNVRQRAELERRAADAAAAGTLDVDAQGLVMRLADAQISLPFALEVVPFAGAGLTEEAAALERVLVDGLMARMAPQMALLYYDLRELFLQLKPDWGADALALWCRTILDRLSAFLSQGGAAVTLRLAAARPTLKAGRLS